VHWLFEAKKRFGLCVLNYMVTSNHIHLLVKDADRNVIAQSMQFIASRTAQEFNRRKGRQGAFWEDRYHATAIASDQHLHRCIVYVDLNRVRAGVVKHPSDWAHSGYLEIQQPPERYTVIDLQELSALCGFSKVENLQRAHRQWIEQALVEETAARETFWSEAVAVGSLSFVDKVKDQLGIKALHREIAELNGTHRLREPGSAYRHVSGGENDALRQNNGIVWQINAEVTEA
jgi:REP element-mobilizing transposase RayT